MVLKRTPFSAAGDRDVQGAAAGAGDPVGVVVVANVSPHQEVVHARRIPRKRNGSLRLERAVLGVRYPTFPRGRIAVRSLP